MQNELNILHLEDDRLDAELVRDTLCADGILANIVQVQTEKEFRCSIRKGGFQLVLADYSLPGFDGMSALKIVQEENPELPFIFVTGTIGEEVAIETLKSGATDCVLKQRLQRLGLSVRRALSEADERARRKLADHAVRESETRYRRLFESAKDGILILDADSGEIVDVNPFLLELLAYSKEELIGRTPWEIGVFKDVIASKAAFSKLQREGHVVYEDLPLRARDGVVRRVEFVSHSYRAGEDRVVQCNIRDITARKKTEEQLYLQSAALESAANAIMITDEQGQINWVNPAFTQTTGYSMEEVRGKNPRLLKSGKQDVAFYRDMWDTLLSGKVWRNTIINRCKDGSLCDEDLTITPIRDPKGKVTHFVAIKQDVTALKQALSAVQTKTEELAAMTQQLWQASKLATMGELAASVAHELNNPLATVALRVESLLEQLAGDEPKQHSLAVIMQEVDRMTTLVTNLLQFTRRHHRQVSTMDVREEITNSVAFIQHYLRSRSVDVVTEFADPLPTILADRQHLRQLFLNLLTNAADAMPQGGELKLTAKPGCLNGEAAAAIEFSDTGAGIAPTDLDRIWEPFFTTKSEGQGTGLGLAICRRIVEEHGGTIDIDSEQGQGTAVRITLPNSTMCFAPSGDIEIEPEVAGGNLERELAEKTGAVLH